MGVPKFFRYYAERYPTISQVITDEQIPEFDALYLDMNGIIHQCSHPNDGDAHFRISEEQMFLDIFNYIDKLFSIVRPLSLIYMAIDGVAPRAKLNQQRSRRFRTAKEAHQLRAEAVRKGETLPKDPPFDSNAITPGTEFMVKLSKMLNYFVHSKVTNDRAWSQVKVILSGHEVPGEGEHKIMSYIRQAKSQPNYHPNMRHCIYGLDADLVMLGLVTHEPHFSLLREEVKFGKQSGTSKGPLDISRINFNLLHLSLFREYLCMEFDDIASELPFPFDHERLIDDFVLIGFFMGNDFLPQTPNFHINKDSFPYIFSKYKESLPIMGGYINEGGILNCKRFQIFLEALKDHDRHYFECSSFDQLNPVNESHRNKRGRKNKRSKGQLIPDVELDNTVRSTTVTCPGLHNVHRKDAGCASEIVEGLNELSDDLLFDDTTVDDDDDDTSSQSNNFAFEDAVKMDENVSVSIKANDHDQGFVAWKHAYYIEKFDIEDGVVSNEWLTKVASEMIRGLQWVLLYYYRGVPSWGWFFPYHYAPFVSDLIGCVSANLNFDLGEPFLPFEQLLSVLPAASKELLPKAYWNLMTSPLSSIIEFYPIDFKLDMNGKKNDWEAVVLIPFLDQERLRSAMKSVAEALTSSERDRNRSGKDLLLYHDSALEFTYPSPMETKSGAFPSFFFCHAKCDPIIPFNEQSRGPNVIWELCKEVKMDVLFPGFPTLRHLPFHHELAPARVQVFTHASKQKSMVIVLDKTETQSKTSAIDVAPSVLGKVVYVGWPHLKEARCVAVSDAQNIVRNVQRGSKSTAEISEHSVHDKGSWKRDAIAYERNKYHRQGIVIGEVHVMLHINILEGERNVYGSKGVTTRKVFSTSDIQVAWQSVITDIAVQRTRDNRGIRSLDDVFPIGTNVFYLGQPNYGSLAVVNSIDSLKRRLTLSIKKVPTGIGLGLPFGHSVPSSTDNYYPIFEVSRHLNVSHSCISRITSGLTIYSSNHNDKSWKIGLSIRNESQQLMMPGFSFRSEKYWLYSAEAISLLEFYVNSFPSLVQALKTCPNEKRITADMLFPNGNCSDLLDKVVTFVKSLPTSSYPLVPVGAQHISSNIQQEILKSVTAHSNALSTGGDEVVIASVPPHLVFLPGESDFATKDLVLGTGDRVSNARQSGSIPFGLRGTVVGVGPVIDDNKQAQYIDVLFDKPISSSSDMLLRHLVRMKQWDLVLLASLRHAYSHGGGASVRYSMSLPTNDIVATSVSGKSDTCVPPKNQWLQLQQKTIFSSEGLASSSKSNLMGSTSGTMATNVNVANSTSSKGNKKRDARKHVSATASAKVTEVNVNVANSTNSKGNKKRDAGMPVSTTASTRATETGIIERDTDSANDMAKPAQASNKAKISNEKKGKLLSSGPSATPTSVDSSEGNRKNSNAKHAKASPKDGPCANITILKSKRKHDVPRLVDSTSAVSASPVDSNSEVEHGVDLISDLAGSLQLRKPPKKKAKAGKQMVKTSMSSNSEPHEGHVNAHNDTQVVNMHKKSKHNTEELVESVKNFFDSAASTSVNVSTSTPSSHPKKYLFIPTQVARRNVRRTNKS